MKTMKKLASVLLALVMVMALAAPAFATPSPAPTTGTITIKNASMGETYKIVKLFGAKVNAPTTVDGKQTSSGITYTGEIPEELQDYFQKNTEKDTIEAISVTVDETTGERTVTVVDELTSAAQAALKDWALKQTIPEKDIKTADGTGIVTFANVEFGYYVVLSSVNDGAAIAVTSTQPNAEVIEKNSEDPGFKDGDGKTVKTPNGDNTVSVGETLEYTIRYTTSNWIKVQNSESKEMETQKVYQYVIHDTLPNFLSVDGKVKIHVEVETKNADGTSTWTTISGSEEEADFVNNTITVKWTTDGTVSTDSKYPNGAKLVVTYNAKVTNNALVENADLTNKVTINPNSQNNNPGSEVKVYTAKIEINKIDGTDRRALANAEFILYKNVEKKVTEDGTEKTVTVKNYCVVANDKSITWVEDKAQATKVTTVIEGDKAVATFEGLANGTYYLEETKAPNGYNLLADPVTVELNETNKNYTVTKEIANNTGATLPSTGGIGTTIFYVGGGILIAAAGILLITKKRMGKAD